VVKHNESKKSRQGNWEQTSVLRWKDSPDPLPDTDVVMYPGRIDNFETVTPGRGFVRMISDSVCTMEQYGGVSIEIGAIYTTLDHGWSINSVMWEHLKSGWLGAPEELIRKVKMDCDREVVLERRGYRSTTWCTLRALHQVHGEEQIWGCTCVTSPPFFSQIGFPVGRSYETATDKSVVIMWDGLNVEERESVMSWMTMSKSWVL
jgi:hypothetical protein